MLLKSAYNEIIVPREVKHDLWIIIRGEVHPGWGLISSNKENKQQQNVCPDVAIYTNILYLYGMKLEERLGFCFILFI